MGELGFEPGFFWCRPEGQPDDGGLSRVLGAFRQDR
jgi:hypothetical protein